ncbi:MAG: sigma-54 dependent transcriptional regulator [Myxococcota bacterium]
MSGRVLIVDDDATFQRTLARALKKEGFDVTSAHSAAEAREALPREAPDVVVLDYQLPDADGLGLLEELQPEANGATFVMATAFPEVDVAVEAMRRGARDYVPKSGALEECLLRIQNAAHVASLGRSVAEATAAKSEEVDQGLLGESTPMRRLKQQLQAVLRSDDLTVQILGETGTGKGVVARWIHFHSGRAALPFVAVDCTTIPDTLFESELFGHEKGAFSGAAGVKMGKVEAAGRGTLFLDEIGELDLAMQAKLLRVLEEGEYTRVGSTRTKRLEARVIAATNRDLEVAVAQGRFRADLRYRLERFVVQTPPLRERGDDVLRLAHHFVAKQARALGRPTPTMADPLLDALRAYAFPGNVRELRNMVEQALVLASTEHLTLGEFPVLARALRRGSIPPGRDGSLPPPPAPERGSWAAPAEATQAPPANEPEPQRATEGDAEPAPTPQRRPSARAMPGPVPRLADIKRESAERECAEIVAALRSTRGNVSAAAKRLGFSRYQLMRRLRKHGLR